MVMVMIPFLLLGRGCHSILIIVFQLHFHGGSEKSNDHSVVEKSVPVDFKKKKKDEPNYFKKKKKKKRKKTKKDLKRKKKKKLSKVFSGTQRKKNF